MSDAKTYVFGQDSNCMNWIAPLLQQKGIDPSVLAMMNNGGFGNVIWFWSNDYFSSCGITINECLKKEKVFIFFFFCVYSYKYFNHLHYI